MRAWRSSASEATVRTRNLTVVVLLVMALGVAACGQGPSPTVTSIVATGQGPTGQSQPALSPSAAPPTPTQEAVVYFPEAGERPFEFQILDSGDPPQALCMGGHACRIEATYLRKTSSQSRYRQETAFSFEAMPTGEPLTLVMSPSYATRVPLVPGTIYQLLSQSLLAWPDTFGLLIKEGDQLVFLGVADWEVDRTIRIGCLAPVAVKQVRLLTNHYREGDQCYDRFTATEVAFSLDGETILLHQGETATLGGYEIYLPIARNIDYYYCPDSGLHHISYTISRRASEISSLPEQATGTAGAGSVPDPSQAITFHDPLVEGSVRLLVERATGPIMPSDLQELACYLPIVPGFGKDAGFAVEDAIFDLGGLEHCANLQVAVLSGTSVTDLSPLASLTNLGELQMDHGALGDLSPLQDLASLTRLRINNNQISDLLPLSGLTNLQDLYARDNQISDAGPLSTLASLRTLNLDENYVTDLSPLSPLVGLTQLSLYRNGITDLTPLSALVNLTELKLDSNAIVDISPLSPLVRLTDLSLTDNQITDVAPLAPLISLTGLWLQGNRIRDISALAHLTGLRWLDLTSNQIEDISPLVENTGLGEGDRVFLGGNPLTSASFREGVQQLIDRGVIVDW